MADGFAIFICGRGRRDSKPCKESGCGQASVALCDWPLGGTNWGKTCDRPLCRDHRRVQTRTDGDTVDFCPTHEKMSKLPHVWCPRCHVASWNKNDVENRYCGRCHEFHANMPEVQP